MLAGWIAKKQQINRTVREGWIKGKRTERGDGGIKRKKEKGKKDKKRHLMLSFSIS